ncbi:MAG TPA: tripartite tricarboxylate transporter substrate binding protein [Burkholderiales bacterium]|nr:tripartite tricarboxylate transporter substrate binding protein [Burkholderiales bacterium]
MKNPLVLAALAGLILPMPAWAQDPAATYPSRPIRVVVPFPPGGAADALPRIVGERLAARWGQPVVVENRAGASGSIGAEAVWRAEPDGYTLLSTPPAPLVINPSLYAKLPYDPAQLVPVCVIAAIPSVLLVNAAKVPATTLQDFVALVRANPDRFNYASQGTTTVSFLTTEMFKAAAGGLRITHVPYKGTGPGLAALLAGEVEVMFDNLGVTVQHVRSGRLRALAVGSERRAPALPDVPAMAEFYPGFTSVAWFSVSAPPKTPAGIAEKLSRAIAEALKEPSVADRLADLSAEAIGSTPAEMTALMKADAERWRAVIRAAGVKAD